MPRPRKQATAADAVFEPRITRGQKRLAKEREDKITNGRNKQSKKSKQLCAEHNDHPEDTVNKTKRSNSKTKVIKKEQKTKVIKKENTTGVTQRTVKKGKENPVKVRKEQSSISSKSEKLVANEGIVKVKKEGAVKGEVTEMAGFLAKGGKFVGAHTSAAGGLWNAVSDAVEIKARAFALFLKSQRQWNAKPLEEDVITKFQSALKEHGFHPDFILPHGSYLLNCGSPKAETLQKSRDALLDEVQRCQRLGLNRYNFHPGSTCGEISVEKCLDLIGESINGVLEKTSGVTVVVENMSCQGNTVGGKFEELKGIIDRVNDKSRIGVCLDTCHAFAAGFDLSTADGYKKMMDDFEEIVGFEYLKGVHLNDSKGKVGCHLDRHENIGKGFIGLEGFRRVMNDPRFEQVPLILETPPGLTDAEEIDLLYAMID
ncbi:DNA-(apurinic or apyrimidinic site) lyase [Holothuria leucospilota]|uniref:DNA-(Apurinic or apyrimidinic site) lyase n=1 Tax=Holothuria leucospilota TaxID=206669 RepID=A0A9Q1C2N9_HOLLE|nr:DNA-(apurinic or apyrimidinic site) lyase [Holothuria leucospilota]